MKGHQGGVGKRLGGLSGISLLASYMPSFGLFY